MIRRFAPGCALMLYKPHLAARLSEVLAAGRAPGAPWMTCCRKDPGFTGRTTLINVCPGCDKRFRLDYAQTSTESLWEILADSQDFPFPDYGGRPMSIVDACPTRDQPRIHEAVRALLRRMNIRVVEPRATGTRSICCGDSAWGELPTPEVVQLMERRGAAHAVAEVVVYCVSCTVALTLGGKKPRYLVDLLFGEETSPPSVDLDDWHSRLQAYIDAH